MKHLRILIVAILCILALTACGNDEPTASPDKPATKPSNSTTANPTTEPTNGEETAAPSEADLVAHLKEKGVYYLKNHYSVIAADIVNYTKSDDNRNVIADVNITAENDVATITARYHCRWHLQDDGYKKYELDPDPEWDVRFRAMKGPSDDDIKYAMRTEYYAGLELIEVKPNLEKAEVQCILIKEGEQGGGVYRKTNTKMFVMLHLDPETLKWNTSGSWEEENAQWDFNGTYSARYYNGEFYQQDDYGTITVTFSELNDKTFHIVVTWAAKGGKVLDEVVEYDKEAEQINIGVNIMRPTGYYDSCFIHIAANKMWIDDSFYGSRWDNEYLTNEEDIPDNPYVTPDDTEFRYTLDEDTKTAVIRSYIGEAQFLWIPDKIEGEYTVVGIDDEAFAYNDAIAIHIPETVTRIGNSAFYGCSFYEINIPSGVTYIGDKAFANCSHLMDIQWPARLDYLGYSAFYNTPVVNVTIPDYITKIPENCFAACTDLQSVIMHDGLTEIGVMAFKNCVYLSSIEIPSSVKVIRKEAFRDCTYMSECIFNEGLEEIGELAFSYTRIEKIILPDTLTALGKYAFSNVENVKYLKISSGLKELSEGCFTFHQCKLTALYIPEGVKIIHSYAFNAWTSLVKVALPTSLKTVKEKAFGGCKNLTTVYYAGTEDQWAAVDLGGSKLLQEANTKWNTTGDLENTEPIE